MKYVSLHNSTIFSIMASVIRPEALMKYAKENGMKAVAVTDRFTLSGIWSSYKAAKDAGVKLIVGCSLNFVYDLDSFGDAVSVKDKKKLETIKNIVLIAKNKTGYVNLLNINRESFDTRYNKQPLISWRHLEKYSEGLVLLTGDASGILAYELCNNNKEKAIENYNRLNSIFGEDLYVEFIPNNLRVNECDQFVANRALYNLYKELDFNVVATSGAKYLNKDHAKYLELVNCVKKKFGFDPDNVSNNQQYLHTYEDIFKLFKRNFGEEFADLVCANSVRIAKKCEKPEWIKPEVISNDKIQLPTYPIQDHDDYNEFLSWKENVDDSLKHLEDDKLFMRFLCYKNLYKVPQDKLDIYKQRLEMELPVFEQLGFSSYMLITYDFIDWAVKHDIPVGSGRGCVNDDCFVLTDNGYKKIKEINVGEKVFSHTGNLRNVLNKFEFDTKVGEKCIKIKTEKSFGDLVFTKNHKLYAITSDDMYSSRRPGQPSWIPISELKVGDYCFMPYPNNPALFGTIIDMPVMNERECNFKTEQSALEFRAALLHNRIQSNTTTNEDLYTTQFDIEKDFALGYFVQIKSLTECDCDKVYDITVEQDHSYLTQNFASHNSVGGSLVGYVLGIHHADPIKYGLVFERFLNIEKTSFPDIDNDFDADGRERVLQYVTFKYGPDYVAHVSNLLTFTPKVALTDVITCLQIGGDRKEAFRIAKNITETIDAKCKTLEGAIESSKLLEEFLNEHPEVKDYAESIIGLVRSWATHAAGVIIGKYPLKGLAPLRLDDNGVVVLEWEKEQTEENGLVKVDFLGLETLSIIKNSENIRASLNKPKLPPINYDHYYKEVYDLIKNGNTAGIFQLGASGGTVGLCNMTEPTKIEDVAVINALARPGVPPDIKKSYINRKFGKEQVIIPHKNLERAVKDTFGYCIFEESFLFLAHDFCGWNLQKGDKMRKVSKMKAKGKKLLDEMHEDFVKSSVDYSEINEDLSRKIWDEWIVPLSGYAFNKSHSILYSMTSLQTAYWKAYSTNEFLTANLISETRKNNPKSKANVLKYIQELQANGVQICTPDINDSFATYRLISDDKLLTGFSSLHGVKEPAALDIIEKRPFSSFEDFLLRTDSSKVRISVVQALAASGALDCFGLPRKTMCLYAAELRKKLKAVGKTTHKVSYTLPKEEFSIGEIRSLEMKYLGRAISGTKNHSFPKLFSGNKAIRLVRDIVGMKEKANITVEGEIVDMFSFKVGKKESKIFGQECLRVVLEDINNEPIKIIFFPDAFQKLKDMYGECFTKKFEKGFGIRVSGHVNHFDNQISIVANEIYGIFLPVDASNKFENKKPQFVVTNNKKPKDISQDDIEKDLLLSMERT